MKKLPLNTPAFRHVEKAFSEWLDILGYSPASVRALPTHAREFLHYLETEGHTRIDQIDTPLIQAYYRQLSQRTNHRRGGGLSNSSLNIHLNALEKLLDYLRTQARILLPPTGIPRETPDTETVLPLTPGQIKSLYAATYTYEDQHPERALLDRAILAIFYDCGLRRNEGVQLNLSDLDFDRRLINVRRAKGGQPRLVPFGKTTGTHLQNYRYEGRPLLMSTASEEAFLLNLRGGRRASGQLLTNRLKYIQSQVEDPTLQSLNLHLHLLRHSIATHLLYQGMELENLARFLGHRTLSSTQVYTHIMSRDADGYEN